MRTVNCVGLLSKLAKLAMRSEAVLWASTCFACFAQELPLTLALLIGIMSSSGIFPLPAPDGKPWHFAS